MTTTTDLVLRAGDAATGDFDLEVTPESAGWQHTSLRVLSLSPGATRVVETALDEVLLVPLSGGASVRLDDDEISLVGRASVFDGPTDFAYLPVDSRVTVTSSQGGRYALAGARTGQRLPFRYGAAADVPVEVRGAGQATRLVRNFATVDAFETAAVIACEVITPGGNWSSYPAHKHDEASPHESVLEEIYYFEIAPGPSGEPGLGYHRTTSSPRGEIDVLVEVHDRDTALVPYGWHGPCVAAPGHDMFYLNVMAGPADERAWLISDHPDQTWVRETWNDQLPDPRVEGRR
jgi:5-deoxy-glucuronate isomerase